MLRLYIEFFEHERTSVAVHLRLFVRLFSRSVTELSPGREFQFLDQCRNSFGKRDGAGTLKEAEQGGAAMVRCPAFPLTAGLGAAGKGDLQNRRKVALGVHDFHEQFGGTDGAVAARIVAPGGLNPFNKPSALVVLKGGKESLERPGLAQFAGEFRAGEDGAGIGEVSLAANEREFASLFSAGFTVWRRFLEDPQMGEARLLVRTPSISI